MYFVNLNRNKCPSIMCMININMKLPCPKRPSGAISDELKYVIRNFSEKYGDRVLSKESLYFLKERERKEGEKVTFKKPLFISRVKTEMMRFSFISNFPLPFTSSARCPKQKSFPEQPRARTNLKPCLFPYHKERQFSDNIGHALGKAVSNCFNSNL